MRLEELLSRLPPKELEKWRSAELSSAPALARELEQLKPWAAVILKLIIRLFGPLPAEQGIIERAALDEGLSGAHVKAALLILRRRGLLFALRKSWGEELYIVPEEAIPVWHRLLFSRGLPGPAEEQERLDYEGEEAGSTGCAAYDVLCLLYLADSGQLKLTKQGELTKAAVAKLKEGLMVKDEDLIHAGLAPGNFRWYGPAVQSVLHMAVCSGVLGMRTGEWVIKQTAARHWLAQSVNHIQQQLYRHWIEAVRSPEAWELHALWVLEQAVPGRWYMVDQLFEWLRDCGMINSIASDQKEHFVQARLLPMQALGWFRLNKLPEGYAYQVIFSLSGPSGPSLDSPYKGLMVQPDMELVLAPYPPVSLLWQLMAWAAPVTRDVIYVFRLTRNSVSRGLEQGRSPEELVAVLNSFGGGPLNEEVRAALEEWFHRPKAVLETGLALLRLAADSTVCASLESREGFRQLVKERLGTGLYLLPAAHVKQMQKELASLDVLSLELGGESLAGEEKDLPPALLPHFPVPACSVLPADSPGGEQESNGEWRDLPAAWWKSPGSYHSSTEKALVREAIERKMALTVAMSSGSVQRLVPLSLQERGEEWEIEAMRGREKVRISSGQWGGLGLIVPGLNE